MKRLSLPAKISLYLSVLAGSLWLGSYLVRHFQAYQLFEGQGLVLRQYVNAENINAILISLNPSVITTFVLYIVFILSFILFLVLSRLSLKLNGWLFISSVLIFITMPFEIYLMTIDYKIISLVKSGAFDGNSVVQLMRDRFSDLSSFTLVEIFCYFAVVFFVVFKPFEKRPEKLNEN